MAEPDDRTAVIRRTYGRGYVEGLKAAGIQNIGDFMNSAKLRSLEQGLNGQTRKVYEALPIESSATLDDIIRSCASHGARPDKRVVEACVLDLVDRGLARSNGGQFQRVVARPVMVPTPEIPGPAEPERTLTPLEQLADIELRLKIIQKNLVADLEALRGDLTTVAVIVEDQVKDVRKDLEKFDTLKNLLRDM